MRDITKALAKRHKDDMFFTEVKNGPTQTVAHHSRIDALAIKISWTRFRITGYEIKVSRSDFLRDEKWHAYLPMCNQLYFAVAPGVCDVEEIPDVCGLVVMNSKGGIRTIKKAPWRDIEPPVEMFKYLMFTYIGALHRAETNYPRHERLLPNERLELCRMYLEDNIEQMKRSGGLTQRMINEIQQINQLSGALLESVRKSTGISTEILSILRRGVGK